MKAKYYLQGDEFVIENYNNAKPFASFLPGIAGLHGKPLWAFYANRGQCMASFGTNSKEGAIMEFYPANTAYRRTSLEGFRTFLKIKHKNGRQDVYEPFRIYESGKASAPLQKLYISPHEFRIEETDKKRSLRCEVIYYTVPGEDFPALARVLKVQNLSGRKMDIELVDGMPKLEPYGMNDWFMKHMSRTIEAWMEVLGLDEGTPFYKLRTDAADVSEIRYITAGNFYFTVVDGNSRKVRYIADPRVIFGDLGDFTYPAGFDSATFRVPAAQIDKNITPSAFSHCSVKLGGWKTASVSSLIGHAESFAEAGRIKRRLSEAFFDSKRLLNKEETQAIASSVSVFSGIPEFDLYARQTNLDNIMRGGYPITVGCLRKKVIYVFNRKHGDLERDYNNFVLRPEFYSQGNGNFRDANQNRRLSVWLNPETGRKDIKDFYDLIQLDGYNPLVIKGDVFTIEARKRERLLKKYLAAKDRPEARKLLSGSFTPGDLMKLIARSGSKPAGTEEPFNEFLGSSTSMVDAEHGEGYWIDHWTYNLDLVESYLGLFPENKTELLFGDADYMFFDEAHMVKPRKERYLVGHNRRMWQYRSVFLDNEKKSLIDSRKKHRTWVRTKKGKGDIYRCTLAAKMLSIIANKIATLDTRGIGIEMEADKPAWCDPMNGLPGVRGSSVSETIELKRLVDFLAGAVRSAGSVPVRLPVEVATLVRGLAKALKGVSGDHAYWNRSNTLKEEYREAVRFGIDGKEADIGSEELAAFLALCKRKLERGIRKAYGSEGIPHTYFMNDGKPKALPLSLEGAVHALKIERDIKRARSLYMSVRNSRLYDKGLGMYKVNVSLAKEPLEIGRIRAFVPGWLENESIWLHMEYKFMLEALRQGLYKEFYNDLKKAAIPFQDPARYGRSMLENSSFITPSTFFDRDQRGNGFVARLSGSTAEFLHMLLIMNLGPKPFFVEDGELLFMPSPVLDKMFFTKEEREIQLRLRGRKRKIAMPAGSYAFTLFRDTLVTYANPKMRSTFGGRSVRPVRYKVRYKNGREYTVAQSVLGEPFSSHLREGAIEHLSVLLG